MVSYQLRTLLCYVFCFYIALTFVLVQSQSQCGRTLVAYGNGDKRVNSPWTALLFRRNANGAFVPWISGVIVGPQTVLTRGRQFWEANEGQGQSRPRMRGFKPSNLVVGVGIYDANSFTLDGVTQLVEVATIRPHPKSYQEHSEYDLAIVQLRKPIHLTSKVHPICVEHASNATFTSTYDFRSKFLSAPKRVSGYLRGTSTVHAIPHTLRPDDVCDPRCQGQAPSSSEPQLQLGVTATSCFGSGPREEIQNMFAVGASVATWHLSRWYLTGIVANSYAHAQDCKPPTPSRTRAFKHFVSLIASSVTLNWINAAVQNGPEGTYSCLDGSAVEPGLVCDGRVDCERDGGSDEDSTYCEALGCPSGDPDSDLCRSFEGDNGMLRIRNGPNSFISLQVEPMLASTTGVPETPRPTTTTAALPPTTTPRPRWTSTSTTRSPPRQTAPTWSTSRWWSTTRRTTTTTTPTPPPRRPFPAIVSVIAFPDSFTTRRPRPRPQTTRTTTTTTTMRPEPSTTKNPGECLPIKDTQNDNEVIKGIQFQCTNPDRSRNGARQIQDACADSPQPTGTKVLQTCMQGYKAVGRASFLELTCGREGTWLGRTRYLGCIAECGLPKTAVTGHIVNGTVAQPSNWPWNAALFTRVKDEFEYLCGATMITTRALITAAHCVKGTGKVEDFRIVLAPTSSRWSTNTLHRHAQIMEVSQVHIHELYNPTTFEADIAVLKTSRLVTITDSVYPACFPFPGRENQQIERFQTSPGSVGIVAGFGTDETFRISETLKEVRLPVVSVRECFKVLNVFPSTTQLCTGYTNGISVCNGDSGAGLMFQEEGARKLYFLQAIVSYGQSGSEAGLCDYNRYSIFTKVGPFKEWVEQIVASD